MLTYNFSLKHMHILIYIHEISPNKRALIPLKGFGVQGIDMEFKNFMSTYTKSISKIYLLKN